MHHPISKSQKISPIMCITNDDEDDDDDSYVWGAPGSMDVQNKKFKTYLP